MPPHDNFRSTITKIIGGIALVGITVILFISLAATTSVISATIVPPALTALPMIPFGAEGPHPPKMMAIFMTVTAITLLALPCIIIAKIGLLALIAGLAANPVAAIVIASVAGVALIGVQGFALYKYCKSFIYPSSTFAIINADKIKLQRSREAKQRPPRTKIRLFRDQALKNKRQSSRYRLDTHDSHQDTGNWIPMRRAISS